MLKLFTFWAGCLLLLVQKVNGQSLLHQKVIPIAADTVTLDTLSIVPGSVRIKTADNLDVSTDNFRIDAASAQLIWKRKPVSNTVTVTYKTFPILFTKKYSKYSKDVITEAVIDNTAFRKKEKQETNTLFSMEGLNKSGSISRSVGVGNNHDLALNSNMTLQLSGKITDDLEILAAISDDNIPIQAEGNTQQLNEFDKVFIQLKRKNSILTGGDYEIRRPDSYFMNFFKRTQGASFSTSYSSKGWKYKSGLSMAVAKGRSSRLQLNGIEGNQGPYRITGANGEQAIVVLSGTERVYVDGVLMQRGQENQYTINYNLAEITFTAKKLITQNSRIIIEFEYSDKNYSRSLTYFNQEAYSEKINFKLNYYNEQDNKNKPFLQDLTDQQKSYLKEIGNSINEAYISNIDTVDFNTTEVLYKQIDTLGASGVYVYSTNPALAHYRPGFSFVGTNAGNYRISTNSLANGRVFEYLPPIAGLKQGDYEPVSLLVTPKKKQLVTLGTDFKPSKNTLVSTELAFSDNDVNLFSNIGNKENQGFAFRFLTRNSLSFKKDSTSTKLITTANYEHTSRNFSFLERYRAVEFERDFNLFGITPRGAEHLLSFSASLFKTRERNITYQFNCFTRDSLYSGFQNSLEGQFLINNFRLSYSGKFLNSSSNINSGYFLRQKADLSREFKYAIAGLNFEQEHNKTNLMGSLLSGNSFAFDQYTAYLSSPGSSGNFYKVQYSKRFDKLPISGALREYSAADVISGELGIRTRTNSTLTITTTYRDINYREQTSQPQENSLLGRLDYTFSALKGFINSSIFYEIGPGREPKREFSYLEVITGQGAYAWNDYNNNGIKELNEFEIARYQDQARYIRVYQNTNEFINSTYNTVNITARITPASVWKNLDGIFKVINRFSSQSAFKTERKLTGEKGFAAYYPLSSVEDQKLISDNTYIRNTLFFNRNNPAYGIDLNFQNTANKILLINGFDSRSRSEQGLRWRWNIKKITTVFELKQSNRLYQSELFPEKNYRIKAIELLPEAQYLFSSNFRWGINGMYRSLKNRINNRENSMNYRFGTDIRYNILTKGVFTSGLNWVRNNFNGDRNTSLAYEMLEGLLPGNNVIWTTGLQRTITQGVQMTLSYEGRKSSSAKAIHNGSVQFRAFF
ncbi:hypothetical protein [Desertivirga arenae]|uniref:hypothetical protein n=1 Tax=Desertivirga arenae TaxID=2810309 RepID=UPI001A979BEC|nr:hypothetical protein [Pedobacter sp. SYSU D00823]